MKGFTLIEVLILIAIVGIIAAVFAVPFMRGYNSSDIGFMLTESKDIKLLVNPVTGETLECIRPFTFSEWKCRPVSIKPISAEKVND